MIPAQLDIAGGALIALAILFGIGWLVLKAEAPDYYEHDEDQD